MGCNSSLKDGNILVGVTGVSGSGKTTLIRELSQVSLLSGREVIPWEPHLASSREYRHSDMKHELQSLSRQELQHKITQTPYDCLQFEAHGYLYAYFADRLAKENQEGEPRKIYLQILPPQVISDFKTHFQKWLDTYIFAIQIDVRTAILRFQTRGDQLTLDEMKDRASMKLDCHFDSVDCFIDGNQSVEQVVTHAYSKIQEIFTKKRLNHVF